MNAEINKYIINLKTNPQVLGIILFGSYARGNNRVDSDVDLIVIRSDGFERSVEYSDNLAYEITYTTEEGAIKYWRENIDACVDLWSTGKVLFDRGGTVGRLRKVAQEIKLNGKPSFSKTKREHLLFDAKDQINSVKDNKNTDTASALMLLSNKVFHLAELYFDLRSLWKPAPKQLFQVLDSTEPGLANLLREFYSDATLEGKIAKAESIVSIVFSE